jgi:hypothetical protein
MPKQVSLVSAVQTAEDYDLRQPPPNYQQIAELTPEDYVKLKARGEYFWVKVDAVDPYVGIVMDDPVFNQKFQKGDKIYFEDVNVFDLRAKEWLNNERI